MHKERAYLRVPTASSPHGLRESLQGSGHVGQRSPAALALDQSERSVGSGQDEVDLEALLVSEHVELASAAGVDLLLRDLGGDESLEKSAEERRAGELRSRRNPEKMAGE